MGAPHVRALGILSGRPAPAPGPAVWALPRPERTGDRFRRATRECLLALAAVDAMLEDGRATREAIAGDGTALLYVTAAAYGASNREFIERRGGVMHFAYTANSTSTDCPARAATSVAATPEFNHSDTAAWRRSYGRRASAGRSNDEPHLTGGRRPDIAKAQAAG